ncbi:MAG: methyltransferase [Phreatobacter sp.]|uniref:tRNA1(Val) (adenine(37)-N6)-methyltransferase n=1 Tax=Phreatobacter sp. TaxID=1966341 RepID=UPI001A5B68B4|nr:methyltransferase [Phreatobacter sp.]MBL8567983.1 methyltransferase [Phreatobacter sp.]
MTEPATTSGTLLGGRLRFEQPARGYRVAIDPVLLAASVGLARGRVLDLGAGAGAAGLCLAWRVPGVAVTAVEIDETLTRLAARNAAANGLASRLAATTGDVLRLPRALHGAFDAVVTNPPFETAARASPSPDAARRRAHVEGEATLERWVRAAHRALKPRGRLFVVHRADRLGELLAALGPRFGDVEIVALWPRAGAAAKRVIVRARRDARGALVLHPGLVLHEADGRFTAAAERILRDGAALGAGPA